MAVRAVDEVGNPTILATFAVIAALLPMAFVSGLMGPYMRPIPVGASAAMLLSLLIAFIISPWLSYIVLGKTKHRASEDEKAKEDLDRLQPTLREKPARGSSRAAREAYIAFSLVVVLLLGCVRPGPAEADAR